jgi:hypothetical protein
MNVPIKPIPTFANEAEERRFWEIHDSTDYIDWSKARGVSRGFASTATLTLDVPLADGGETPMIKKVERA